MKLLLKIIIFIVAVVFIATAMGGGRHSHVIIFFYRQRVDLSLASLIIIIGVLFLCIYYLIRLWIQISYLPNRIRKWSRRHRYLKGQKYLHSASVNYFAGSYAKVYKNALSAIRFDGDKENKFLAQILAFKSSTYINNQQEERLVELNAYTEKRWQLAKLMVIAEAEYAKQNYGNCLDHLNQVLHLDKKHILARRLMLKVYLHLENYYQAYEILIWLIRHNCLEKIRQDNYILRILRGVFANFIDKNEMINFYRKLDKTHKENDQISKFYFVGLLRLKQYETAIKLVNNVDAKAISTLGEDIVTLAKRINDKKEANELFTICEKHLINDKQNAKLLLAMGILSFTLQFWINARNYIESSIAIRPCFDGYLYLSFVARKINDQNLLENIESSLIENICNVTE